MINLLLSGGSGTRLWPLSRKTKPKQFIPLFSGQSLFQLTSKRHMGFCERTIIVSNVEHYFLASEQLKNISISVPQFLLESVGRNTAPAIALACMSLDPETVVLVTPSDHLIDGQDAYQTALLEAEKLAQKGFLVTFGIQPTYAETGFGYIESQGQDVLSFKEKPSLELAQAYVDAGHYYWNAGIFCFQAGVLLQELRAHSSEVFLACERVLANHISTEDMRFSVEEMQSIPDISIDYALMEKSKKVKVVPCYFSWSDLGSFDSIHQEFSRQTPHEPNIVLKHAQSARQPIAIESKNNLIYAQSRQISLIGIEDLLVIDTDDAILISHKGRSQQVRDVVAQVGVLQPDLLHTHRLVHRPWGSYEVLVEAKGYKIKKIVVKPGGRLSLQRHAHRSEHWVVVSGVATVTIASKCWSLQANESTYIPAKMVHRLENTGTDDLIVVETQVGDYLAEDDIERLDDAYGRYIN